MVKTKTLEAIQGTGYEVNVTRDEGGNYNVEVKKPANDDDPYADTEVVAIKHLDWYATETDLNRLVERIINEDIPSLVGEYTSNEEGVAWRLAEM